MIGAIPLTQDQIDLVLAKGFEGRYKLRNQTLFILGLTTGFRISELLSLKLEDLYNPDGTLKNYVKVSRQNTKGKNSSRSTPLLSVAHPYVRNLSLSSAIQGEDYLFKSRQSDAAIDVSQAWRILDKAFRRAGIYEVGGTHTMRKTFAKRVYEATSKNIYETQKALGHKSIDSTTSYLSFDRNDLDEKIKQLF